MKKLQFIFIIYLLMQVNVFAQNGWKLIYSFDEEPGCIAFVNSQKGYVGAAHKSRLYETNDGGITWHDLTISGLNAKITKIIFVDDTFYIGVGGKGTIIKSTDAGSSWSVINIGDTLDLRSICSTGNGNLFVCQWGGSKICKSDDNGETWTTQPIEGHISFYYDVGFINNDIGYAVGYPVAKTTDRGESWVSISDFNYLGELRSIKFLNENIGYLVSVGKISKTIDGGKTWQIEYETNESQLFDITTWDDNIAWAAGGGKIVKTINGGTTWSEQSFSPYHYLQRIVCADSLTCFAIGNEGAFYKTTNGGLSAPTLTFPENNATELPLTLTLSWGSLTDNNLFRVQVSSDPDFNNIIIDSVVTARLMQIKELSLNSVYYWRVQEKFQYIDSPWSQPLTFKTTEGSPILSFPLNGSIDLPLEITFTWNDVTARADSFQLQLSVDSSFSNLIYNNSQIINDTATVNQLSDNTLFYWRVRAKVKDVFGEWSETWSFTTLAKTPRLISPINNSILSPMDILLQWSETVGTTEYLLQVSTDSLFRSTDFYKNEITNNSISVTLNYDTRYYWRVGANNTDGQIYWSNYSSLKTRHFPKATFPLDIGTKWYYKATSNQRNSFYGITKEVRNILDNGFREISTNYIYIDSTTSSKEYWAYTDGKFYINSKPDYNFFNIYYDDYLVNDTCDYYACRELINYPIFGISDTAQRHSESFYSHGYGSSHSIIILPGIGIVEKHVRNLGTYVGLDSTFLIGMYRNGEVLGDTTFYIPEETAYFPLEIGQKWFYKMTIPYDYNDFNEEVIKEVTNILDNGFREIKSTYYYEDGVMVKKEYWAYMNDKFYLSSVPDFDSAIVCYDLSLKGYECAGEYGKEICKGWVRDKYKFMDKELDAQIFVDNDVTKQKSYTIVNTLGPVKITYKTISQPYSITESLIDLVSDTSMFSGIISSPLYPSNSSINIPNSVTLKWAKITGAAFYDIQICEDSTFSKIYKEYNNLEDTTLFIDSFDYSSHYYWRVQTNDSTGNKYWSQIWTFETARIPLQYNLYQNYPNPFNPITKIKYDLSKTGHVSLKVYDILGREVKTLVNEEKQAGSYEIKFDGSNLSSGIYFYRLQSGSYVETKKLVLLK